MEEDNDISENVNNEKNINKNNSDYKSLNTKNFKVIKDKNKVHKLIISGSPSNIVDRTFYQKECKSVNEPLKGIFKLLEKYTSIFK